MRIHTETTRKTTSPPQASASARPHGRRHRYCATKPNIARNTAAATSIPRRSISISLHIMHRSAPPTHKSRRASSNSKAPEIRRFRAQFASFLRLFGHKPARHTAPRARRPIILFSAIASSSFLLGEISSPQPFDFWQKWLSPASVSRSALITNAHRCPTIHPNHPSDHPQTTPICSIMTRFNSLFLAQ